MGSLMATAEGLTTKVNAKLDFGMLSQVNRGKVSTFPTANGHGTKKMADLKYLKHFILASWSPNNFRGSSLSKSLQRTS